MPILIYGASVCSLCGGIILATDEVISIPPLTPNSNDPLSIFNDSSFHADCFRKHPLFQQAEARETEVLAASKTPHICTVCGLAITDPDDFLMIDHITQDRNDPLYRCNFRKFHRSHIDQWDYLSQALKLLQGLQDSGKWGGEYLTRLIKALNDAGVHKKEP